LFEIHEISYRRSYRTVTEQIDGHFKFNEFDYLVEARWRSKPPTESDLGSFKNKVDKKLMSTRGLFLSIVGFRQEVILEFTRGTTSNIILMDGSDLTLIFEGHVSLIDALELKTQKAAQEGIIFFSPLTALQFRQMTGHIVPKPRASEFSLGRFASQFNHLPQHRLQYSAVAVII